MAHKKAGGSSSNGRDSNAQRLGIKKFGGETVKAGNVLVRQRGSKYFAGENVGCGKDFTLFALSAGKVKFQEKKLRKFNGQVHRDKFISVVEAEEQEERKKAA